MLESLDELRRKPEYVRRNIAIGITTILSFATIFVWANIPGGGFAPESAKETSSRHATATSPFAALKRIFSEGISGLKNEAPSSPEELDAAFDELYATAASSSAAAADLPEGIGLRSGDDVFATGTSFQGTSSSTVFPNFSDALNEKNL